MSWSKKRAMNSCYTWRASIYLDTIIADFDHNAAFDAWAEMNEKVGIAQSNAYSAIIHKFKKAFDISKIVRQPEQHWNVHFLLSTTMTNQVYALISNIFCSQMIQSCFSWTTSKTFRKYRLISEANGSKVSRLMVDKKSRSIMKSLSHVPIILAYPNDP